MPTGIHSAITDPLLEIHLWLGTGIGIVGFGLAIWAWNRPKAIGASALVGLAAIATALVVQGWYGGAMVHGMDHMNM